MSRYAGTAMRASPWVVVGMLAGRARGPPGPVDPGGVPDSADRVGDAGIDVREASQVLLALALQSGHPLVVLLVPGLTLVETAGLEEVQVLVGEIGQALGHL